MDRRRLQTRVQRMNEDAEQARLQRAQALAQKITDTEIEIVALSEQIYRLRHARGSEDFMLAKERREKLRARLAHLQREADPQSELDKINAQIDAAKAQHAAEVAAEQRRLQEHLRKTAARLANHADGTVRHPAPWDIDLTSPADIWRRRDPRGLGESDPARLVLPWSRFDFQPTIPWRPPVKSATVHDAKLELSRSGREEVAAAAVVAASTGRRTHVRRAASAPRHGTAAASATSTAAFLERIQGGGGGGSVRSGSARSGFGPSPGLGLTAVALPPRLLSTLTAAERARPLHPAYLLPSEAAHPAPFNLLCPPKAGALFSKPARERPATDAEARRTARFVQPDRAFYSPAAEGKPVWQSPHPRSGVLAGTFGRAVSDADWLRAKDEREEAERFRRFYELAEEGGVGGGGSADGGDEDDREAFDGAEERF